MRPRLASYFSSSQQADTVLYSATSNGKILVKLTNNPALSKIMVACDVSLQIYPVHRLAVQCLTRIENWMIEFRDPTPSSPLCDIRKHRRQYSADLECFGIEQDNR